MPAVGKAAPAFALPDQDGTTHALADYAGRWVLLYFYPKDDTPGCTTEACSLRDNLSQLQKLDAAVLGVSADSVKSHKKFADKYKLQFPILADVEKKTIQDYGVWAEKKFMGRTYMGILRSSFLIGPDGKIAKIYEKVKPDGHAQEVMADLAAFTK